MGIALTEHQMMILKHMVRMTEAFGNSLIHIMRNHGLDKIEGCDITLQVSPKYKSLTQKIDVGERDTDFGFVSLIRGENREGYELWATCSEEYERLFDDEAIRAGRNPSQKAEKPLPPDGLWVGDSRNDPPVDNRWEWDVNDSLS